MNIIPPPHHHPVLRLLVGKGQVMALRRVSVAALGRECGILEI